MEDTQFTKQAAGRYLTEQRGFDDLGDHVYERYDHDLMHRFILVDGRYIYEQYDLRPDGGDGFTRQRDLADLETFAEGLG